MFIESVVIHNNNFPKRNLYPFNLRVFWETDRLDFTANVSFFENRCRIKGLYLLDEPEAALSPPNQLAFLKILQMITKKGKGQFIISTHSPIILSFPDAQILSFDCIPIKEIAYEATHSYRFYKSFMNDRAPYLQEFKAAGECNKKEDDE